MRQFLLSSVGKALWLPIAIILLEIVNLISGRHFLMYGIYPRHADALPSIFFAPFLHASLSHFFSNIGPLVVLSYFLSHHGWRRYWGVTLGVILGSGLFVWLIGRPVLHVGASGLVYGWFGYLVIAGLVNRNFKELIISIVVVMMYSGIIWGVVPRLTHVSWEGHLGGIISGILIALIIK